MRLEQPASRLGEVPATPGVYRFYDAEGALLYIGKAKDLSQRVRAYFEGREHGPHIRQMARQIAVLETASTATELEALLLEQRLIHERKPKYNIIFRDDKTYAYVALTKHKHPQIKSFRGKRGAQQDLFGPYVDSGAARARIDIVQKTFKLRSCDDSTYAHRSRPCALREIGRCSAPCVPGFVSDEEYAQQTRLARDYLSGKDASLLAGLSKSMESASAAMEFERAATLRDQIRQLSAASAHQRVEGDPNAHFDAIGVALGANATAIHVYEVRAGLISDIHAYVFKGALDASEAFDAFLTQHYAQRPPPAKLVCSADEAVAGEALEFLRSRWGSALRCGEPTTAAESSWLSQARANARQSSDAVDSPQARHRLWQDKLLELFPSMPNATILRRVECFDISHFQGEAAVASCVVYEDLAMRPEQYRIFNIAPENAGDDFASMKEALIRRYQGAEPERLPQLVLIDGGAGQMSKAREALSLVGLDLPMIGIAKGVTRKLGNEEVICSWGDPSRRVDKSHPALLLLSHIRDESHRFAISRNRKKVAKRRVESALMEIPGVGPSKRKALLLAFGSAAAVGEASEEQLAMAPGVGPALARTIKKHFEARLT
jgi:excinuclease ABC subunit C